MSSTISTCESMAKSLSSVTNAVDQAITTIEPYYSLMQGGMGNYINQYLAVGGIDTDGVLDGINSQIDSEVSKLTDEIRSYSGSCLDAIINPIENSISAIQGYGTSITGAVGSSLGGVSQIITNAVNSVFNFNGILNSLGIGALVDVADNLFGCLSTARCLPFGQIQGSMNKITDVLKSVGLGGSGTFDWKTWMDSAFTQLKNLPQTIINSIKDGFQRLWDGMVSLFDTLKANLTAIVDGIKNFSLTSITGGFGSLVSTVGGALGKVASVLGGGAKTAEPMKVGQISYVPEDG